MIASKTLRGADTAHQQERKLLLLEALCNLADQFAKDPDLPRLIDSVVLTVAGQFTATSAMIVVRSNNLDRMNCIHSAIGKFRDISIKTNFLSPASDFSTHLTHSRPCVLNDLQWSESDDATLLEWREMGARVFVPLVVNGSIIGVMLMGPRVGNLQYSEEALGLLQDFIATITPLIANSFLYADMAALSARHLQILDSVRQAVFVFDSRDVLLMVNRAAIDLTDMISAGDSSELEVGMGIEKVFPDKVYPGWTEHIRKCRLNHSNRRPKTVIAKGPAGERVFSASVSSGEGLFSSGEGTILTLDDKTEETDNERRMFELEKFAEQGMMASSISHELNNHLGMLLGGVELAQIAQVKGLQAKVISTLGKLRENISQMQRFTAGLMDFARVNSQKQANQINDIVSDVVSFAVAQKRFSAVKLNASLTPLLPVMELDKDQIAQVLINILNNAADAILETGRMDGMVVVSTVHAKGEVVLAVSDNGGGMTPEVKEKLFRTNLTTKPKGHGYGLATCAKILEHHNAKISIESKVGFGTTFEFRFPISQ